MVAQPTFSSQFPNTGTGTGNYGMPSVGTGNSQDFIESISRFGGGTAPNNRFGNPGSAAGGVFGGDIAANQDFSNQVGSNYEFFNEMNAANAGTDAAGGGQSWSNFLFGGTDENGNMSGGVATPAIQLGTGIANGVLGFKQLNLAKDQFKEQKRQFRKSFNTQAKSTNRQLRDRQKARVQANPDMYQSVDEYMKQNRIEPSN